MSFDELSRSSFFGACHQRGSNTHLSGPFHLAPAAVWPEQASQNWNVFRKARKVCSEMLETRLRRHLRPLPKRNFFSKAPTTFHGICSVLEIRQPKSDFKIGYPRVAGDICMHFVLLFTVYFRRVYKIFSGVLYLVDFFG